MHSQVCFHRWHFANRVKLHWCITGPVGPLECTNQSWCGVKLLAMSVSTHPVGCVHICHLLGGQHHSIHPNDRFFLPLACHPPQPPHPTPSHPPTPYTQHLWYYRGCKKLSQNPTVSNTWKRYVVILYYVAIRQLYLYGKSGTVVV